MPGTRDHDPMVIEDFQGLWQRGDPESAPSDHFTIAENIQFYHSGIETRDGIIPYLTDSFPPLAVTRVYNYVTQTGQTLLALDTTGNIYHILGPGTAPTTPILTIAEMTDFGFVAINGRAYITPFKTYVNDRGEKYQLGLKNQFLYVYKGDGTPARKAGGLPPTGSPLLVANGATGLTDDGDHLFAVVYETNTGYLTALGPEFFTLFPMDGNHKIHISNIPIGPGEVIKRHIVATKAILNYNKDQKGYQFFFVPGGTIPNNTATDTTVSGDLQFFDSDLISDASHLIDNFSEIPSGVALNTYHSRLVIVGEYGLDGPRAVPPTNEDTLINLPTGITDNRSIARLSYPGEPESISKIDGLIIAPLDGLPLTNVQEFRDILYLFKRTRTFGYSDNLDEPATWQEEVIDQGIGAPVHGIATVLDSGGVNIDFLLIIDWSGLMLFNGTYSQPEMSWKIEDLWRNLDRFEFHNMQIVNDSINKKMWITLPPPMRHVMLHANYANGMNAKDIRWTKWIFDVRVFTITVTSTDHLVIGTPGPNVAEALNVR